MSIEKQYLKQLNESIEAKTIDDIPSRDLGKCIKEFKQKTGEQELGRCIPKLAKEFKQYFNLKYTPSVIEVGKIIDNMPKEYTESVQKSEAKLDRTHIDFDHVGFGLSVKAGFEGKYYTVYLEGYSNNTEKDLEFISDILVDPKTDAEDVENERKIREIRKAIASEISELANEFDAKVLEIVKKHGLKSKKEN